MTMFHKDTECHQVRVRNGLSQQYSNYPSFQEDEKAVGSAAVAVSETEHSQGEPREVLWDTTHGARCQWA